MTTHLYDVALTWTGSTSDVRTYDRSHQVTANGTGVALSADKAFRGDPAKLNPEALLVAAASSCQLLSFLAVAARAGIDVVSYEDDAEAQCYIANSLTTDIRLEPTIEVI